MSLKKSIIIIKFKYHNTIVAVQTCLKLFEWIKVHNDRNIIGNSTVKFCDKRYCAVYMMYHHAYFSCCTRNFTYEIVHYNTHLHLNNIQDSRNWFESYGSDKDKYCIAVSVTYRISDTQNSALSYVTKCNVDRWPWNYSENIH